MRKWFALSTVAAASLFFTVGCNKSESRVEADSDSYDDVGEIRVFDSPRRQRTNNSANNLKLEDAPAPQPMPSVAAGKPAKTAKKPHRHVMVGELNIDD